MASLEGHLVPGIFFIIFGLWWSFVTNIRLIQSKHRSSVYRGTVTMPCICLPCKSLRRAPVESYIKFLFTLIGFLIETIAGLLTYRPGPAYQIDLSGANDHGSHMANGDAAAAVTQASMTNMNMTTTHHEHNHDHSAHNSGTWIQPWFPIEINNAQHTTMYVGFMFGAIVEIMAHHKTDMPKFLEHSFGLFGFFIEGFLFAFHLHGRNQIDIHVHTILVYSIFLCVLFVALEIYNPNQILLTYGRILFTLAQGTWFCQAGFVLYPPTKSPLFQWEPNNHTHIMLLTLAYCWHLILLLALLLIEYMFMKKLYKNSKTLALHWDELIVIDEQNNNDLFTTSPFNNNDTRFLRLVNDDDDSNDEQVEYDGTIKLNGVVNHRNGITNKKQQSNKTKNSASII